MDCTPDLQYCFCDPKLCWHPPASWRESQARRSIRLCDPMKRILYILTGTAFLLPLVVVAALYYTSREKPNHQFNSFDRTFSPTTLVVRDTVNIQYNSYYIAGLTDHSLYLGNLTNPVHTIR